ncbi:MAG: sulfite exporter TauE/SafE family protein [Deltaproteobacteria bacterium]|nr:sulfite exporter TauE/SafE family protein [Deltaproteobacteria bacterium]
MSESQLLLATAASIAFLHTVLGPDHYLVFTMMGRARGWTLRRTLAVTFGCGVGHILSSVLLGVVGLVFGAELGALVRLEGERGDLAGWALLAVGLVYLAWGLRRAGQRRRHSHLHHHEGVAHAHEHDHHREHAHVHDARAGGSLAPWAIFVVFVLGPCEALIPLFMYPAARQSPSLVLWVALVFGLVTLLTMMASVAALFLGLRRFALPSLARWDHALAGGTIALCGGAITFLGL